MNTSKGSRKFSRNIKMLKLTAILSAPGKRS